VRHYHFSGRRDQGSLISGWVMAVDREEAVMQLKGRGVQPFTVKVGPGSIALKVPVDELLVNLRELASLRRSGMAVDQAVNAVIETTEDSVLKATWANVVDMLQSGMSLSDAFAAVPTSFPRYAVPLLRLGESNGELAGSIALVADRLDEESSLQADIKSAMTYPIFLLGVCFAVLLFLFMVVIPKFGAMVEPGSGGSMSFLVAVSSLLREYFWLWGAGLIGAAVWAYYEWSAGRLQRIIWSALQRISVIRSVLESWEVVQFCSSMARLLPGGVLLLDALMLSGESLGRETTRNKISLCVTRVREGGTLGQALAEEAVFPKLVVQMIAVGEKSAHLPLSMEEIARLYERRMRDGIKRVLALLEPAVIVVMGLAVGGIMVSLMSALVSVNDIPI